MRRKNYHWLRNPRTTAEKRANQEGWERPRRRPSLLTDSYDDMPIRTSKSWKDKRKTQYHIGGRGAEHSITLESYAIYEWDLKEYFEEHNIPCRIEAIRESRMYKAIKWKRIKLPWRSPVYSLRSTKKDGVRLWIRTFLRFEENWKTVADGWEWQTRTTTTGYKLTWWWNKDIDIGRILQRCRPHYFGLAKWRTNLSEV